jgi:hypothetical protein
MAVPEVGCSEAQVTLTTQPPMYGASDPAGAPLRSTSPESSGLTVGGGGVGVGVAVGPGVEVGDGVGVGLGVGRGAQPPRSHLQPPSEVAMAALLGVPGRS